MGAEASREIVHEMAVMHRCRGCARIVRLQQLFETPTQFVLVMELGCGGDLQGVLDSDQVPYEPDVIRFVRNLLEGLTFLHEQDIAHLDIKPQNLVLTGPFPDCEVKLCDLEISRQLRPGREVRDMLGTPDYVAPEILRFDAITLAADMWSVGVLTYVLLTGFTPFGGDTDAETFRNIAAAEPEFPDELFEDVSEAAKDFVRSCLHKQPRDRISAVESLQHRWLQPAASPSAPPALSSFLSVPSAVQLAPHTYQPGSLRRSISKSREILSVKVSRSNLKKNISKSRDRLCDMKFGVAKSASVGHFPLTLRASMSRLPDASGGRPPWRGGGVLCTAASPNTFQVRDQYQTQVAAMLGGGSPDTEGAPAPAFVRQNSQRGRKKCSAPQMETAVGRSSLRQQGKKKNSDSVLIRRSCENVSLPQKEPVPDIIVHRDRPEPVASIDGSHANEAVLPFSQENRNPDVPFTASESHENVFTRLYRGGKKDTVINTKQVNGDGVEKDAAKPTSDLLGEESGPQSDEEKPKTKPSVPTKPVKQKHGSSITAGEPHESEKENSRPNNEEGCSLTPIFIEYCTDADRNAKSELDPALLDLLQSSESPHVETGESIPYQTETLRQKPVQHAPECHILDCRPERSQILTSAVQHKANANPVIQKPVPPPRRVLKSKSASEVHLALGQPVEIKLEKSHSTTSQRHRYQKSKSYHDLVSKVFSETPLEEWKLITEDTLIQVRQEPHHIMKKAIPVQAKRDQQNPPTGEQLSKTLPRPSHKFSNRKIIVEEPEKEGPEQAQQLKNQQWTWPTLQQSKPSLPPKPNQSDRALSSAVAQPSAATKETSSSTTPKLQRKENKSLNHSTSKNLTTAPTSSTAAAVASRDSRKPSVPPRTCESFTRYGSLRRRKVTVAHPPSGSTQQPLSTAPAGAAENPPAASHRRQASAPVEVLSYVPARERVQSSHVRQRSAPVQMELTAPGRNGAPSDTPRAVQKHRSMDALKGCEGTVQRVRGRTASEQGSGADNTLCRKASGSAKALGHDGSLLNDRAETPARAKMKDQGTNTNPQVSPKQSLQQEKHDVGVNTEPPAGRREVGVNTDPSRRVASIQNEQIVWEHLELPSANQQIQPQTASRQNSEKDSSVQEAGNQAFIRGTAPRSSRRDACRRPSRPIQAPPGRTSSEGEGRKSRTPPTSPTENPRLLLRKSSTDDDVRHLLSGGPRDEKLSFSPAGRLQRPASLHHRSGSLTSDLGSSSDGGSQTCIVVSFEERSPEPNGSTQLRPVTTRMPERRGCATAAAASPRAQLLRQNSRALSTAGNQRVSSEERLPQKATGDAVSRAVSRFQSLARQARPKKPAVAFGRSASVREKHSSRHAGLVAPSPWV